MYGYRPNIVSTDVATVMHGIKLLVYGRAGTGKTRIAATAPGPLVISAEKGLLSLRGFNIPAIEISSLKELQDVYSWIAGSTEARQFATFALDSVSEIAEQVLTAEKAKTPNKMKAYGELQEQLIVELRRFRDLAGPNIVFLAKQEAAKDAMGNVTYRPWMPGQQLPMAMPYFFDEVFQLNVGKDQQNKEFRFLRTRPDGMNEAKDRSGVLDEFEPADLSIVFRKMLGG